MKRFGEPEEIGDLCRSCARRPPFHDGDTVYVNGGGGWRQASAFGKNAMPHITRRLAQLWHEL
jgi:hypothetical protein